MKVQRIYFNQNKQEKTLKFSGFSNEKTKIKIVNEWLKCQDERRELPQKIDTFLMENNIVCDKLEHSYRSNVIAEIFNNSKEQLKTLAQKYKIKIKLSDDLPVYSDSLPSLFVSYEEKILQIQIKDKTNKKIKPYTGTTPMVKTFVLHKMIEEFNNANSSNINNEFTLWLKLQENNFLKFKEKQLKTPPSFLKRLFNKIKP